MRQLVAFLALGLLLALASAKQKSYEGYQLFKTGPLTKHNVQRLSTVNFPVDFWKDPMVGGQAEVMVHPKLTEHFLRFMNKEGIAFEVKSDNVESLLEASRRMPRSSAPKQVDSRLTFDEYHSYQEITDYIQSLADANPDFASVVSIGNTFEGRPHNALFLEKAGANARANIMIQAGVHAREWIAPAVATYTIYELVENYAAHPEYLDNFNFYIIPVGNPDGYEYTRDNDGDRLWRKTRSDIDNPNLCPEFCRNIGAECRGTDPNRNWDFEWGLSGVSPFGCADTYPGPEAFSEVETRNLRDLYKSFAPDDLPEIVICFHSAAELWLYPYGYAYDQYPDNVDEVVNLAERAVDALVAVNGQNFAVLNSAELYPASGAADDWYTNQGSRFVYTPELRDNGYGFLLPPNQIYPSGTEVWAAWEVMLDQLLDEEDQ